MPPRSEAPDLQKRSGENDSTASFSAADERRGEGGHQQAYGAAGAGAYGSAQSGTERQGQSGQYGEGGQSREGGQYGERSQYGQGGHHPPGYGAQQGSPYDDGRGGVTKERGGGGVFLLVMLLGGLAAIAYGAWAILVRRDLFDQQAQGDEGNPLVFSLDTNDTVDMYFGLVTAGIVALALLLWLLAWAIRRGRTKIGGFSFLLAVIGGAAAGASAYFFYFLNRDLDSTAFEFKANAANGYLTLGIGAAVLGLGLLLASLSVRTKKLKQ